MSFVLYALGALLLAWSGLTVVRGDGFGALDIAATLAGSGAISVGLGAVAAAIKDVGRKIGSSPERSAIVARAETASAPAPKPAAALPPAPTLDEARPRIEEPLPEQPGPSRVEAAMAVKRGLRPAAPVARLRQEPPATFNAPEIAFPRAPELKTVKPAKPPAERRRWPLVKPVPEPASAEAPTEAPKPEPLQAGEPPASRQLEPASLEPSPEPEISVAAPVSVPERRLSQKPAETPSFAASTPEWLVRARARREARAQSEVEGRVGPRQAPAPQPAEDEESATLGTQGFEPDAVEPQPIEPQPVEPQPVGPPAETASPPRGVLREGEHKGVTYRFLEDGSIEAESPHGKRRFSSIEELKETVATARARGELDDPRTNPERPNDDAALDAAIAALEEAPADESVVRQG